MEIPSSCFVLFFREPRTQYFPSPCENKRNGKGPDHVPARLSRCAFAGKVSRAIGSGGESQLTKHGSSMAQDIEAGRETELEAMTGHVVRKAKEPGVPLPVTESVYRMAKGVECAANARRAKR